MRQYEEKKDFRNLWIKSTSVPVVGEGIGIRRRVKIG